MKEITVVLLELCRQIALSRTAEEIVVREYNALGELISNSDQMESVDVKPQGSFNLGTAIKPLNGSDDDFDIDLVACCYGETSAEILKKKIGHILSDSDRYHDKLLPEKKRAWTIEYQNSHVDVVPATDDDMADIKVTNKDGDVYSFLQSSPFKFCEWFLDKGRL